MKFNVQDLIEAIKQADTQMESDKLTPEAKFSDLGADSLDMMNIFVELEDVIGFMVPDEDIDQLTCVNDIYEYVQSR